MSDQQLASIEDLLTRLLAALTGPSASSADAPPWDKISKTLDEIKAGQKRYIETMGAAQTAFTSVSGRLTGLEQKFDAVIDELRRP